MYGKFKDGALELFRGDLLVLADKVIANPREDDLKAVGYIEVHEEEYPTDVANGFHVERRENIEERDVFITYDVVPDNVDMEVEIGDINATTDNSEYDVELEVENQDDGEQADSGNTGNK